RHTSPLAEWRNHFSRNVLPPRYRFCTGTSSATPVLVWSVIQSTNRLNSLRLWKSPIFSQGHIFISFQNPSWVQLWNHNLNATSDQTALGSRETLIDPCSTRNSNCNDLFCRVAPSRLKCIINHGLERTGGLCRCPIGAELWRVPSIDAVQRGVLTQRT